MGALLLLPVLLVGVPASGVAGETPPDKVAAGLHSGDAFAPRLSWDGKWIAYGIREETKGTFRTKYYARSLTGDGVFHSIWPNKHPSFGEKEGVASFTDLVGFQWAKDGKHNAMVVRHKTKGDEVLLEHMDVRFSGPGAQRSPAIAPDGTRLVIVSVTADGSSSDLWVGDTADGAPVLQLTFSPDFEAAPSWHPKEAKIAHEVRNRLGSDLFVFDLDSFSQTPLWRSGTSDEVLPSYSPNGDMLAFLSNKDSEDGLRWDLFVLDLTRESLPKRIITDVRRSENTVGYTWDPLSRYVIAVANDQVAGFPLVIAPADGSKPEALFMKTKNNLDPTVVEIGGRLRIAWVADDPASRADQAYQIVYIHDLDLAEYGKKAGL